MAVATIPRRTATAATPLRLDLVVIGSGLAARTALERGGPTGATPRFDRPDCRQARTRAACKGLWGQSSRKLPGRFIVEAWSRGDIGRTLAKRPNSPSVVQRARRLRNLLAAQDSSGPPAEGVTVFSGEARFTSGDRLEVDGGKIQFRRAILAVACEPIAPAIDGAEATGFLTPGGSPRQFTAVNFASDKHDLGFTLMNQLSVAEKIFPKSEPDVAQDFFALRKIFSGKTWKFTEGRNLLNPASHCDLAWAGALATRADAQTVTAGPIYIFENTPRSRIISALADRSILG